MNETKYVLLIVLFSLSFFGCSSIKSQTETNTNTVTQNAQLITDSNVKVNVVKDENPKVKWIYLLEPPDNGDYLTPGWSLIYIFYEDGEFGTMDVGLQKRENRKTELIAYFDEVVEFGNWKEENGQIKVTVKNCRCDHCHEDHDELTKKQMKNPVPFTQIWRIGKDAILVKANKKYRLIKDGEYSFINYDKMVAEPFIVKDYSGDSRCVAFDLDGL